MFHRDMEACRPDHGTWHEALALPDQVKPVTDDPQNSTRRLKQSERKLSVGEERRAGRLLVLAKARPKSLSRCLWLLQSPVYNHLTSLCLTGCANDITGIRLALPWETGITLALPLVSLESHWNCAWCHWNHTGIAHGDTGIKLELPWLHWNEMEWNSSWNSSDWNGMESEAGPTGMEWNLTPGSADWNGMEFQSDGYTGIWNSNSSHVTGMEWNGIATGMEWNGMEWKCPPLVWLRDTFRADIWW